MLFVETQAAHAVIARRVSEGRETIRPSLTRRATKTAAVVGIAALMLGLLASCSNEPSANVAGGGTPQLPAPEPAPLPLDDARLNGALFDIEEGTMGDAIQAMNALAAAAPSDEQRARSRDPLRAALQHDHAMVRRKAVELLVLWYGRDAVPDLIAILEGKGGTATGEAIRALVDLAPDDDATAAAIAPRLADAVDRTGAVKALVSLGPMAEPHVLPLLAHEDEYTRLAALKVLDEIGTAQSISAVELLAAEPGAVGRRAVKTLAAIRGRE